MSATAARQILSIDRDSGTVETRNTAGLGAIVPVKDLKRPELLRAVKLAFPGIGGRSWQSIGNEAIVNAILTNDAGVLTQDTGTSGEKTTTDGDDSRPNKFPANCGECGTRLQQGAGRIRKEGTKWVTYCAEHLPKSAEPTILWESDEQKQGKQKSSNGDGVTDALTGLITQVVRSELADVTPELDEDKVRKIVSDYVDEQPARRVEIVRNDTIKALPDLHHELLPEVTLILGSGVENVFLVGPAGSGKSTIGEQAAEALGVEARSISFGPTTPTSKLFGYNDATGNYVSTPFRDAYENGLVFIGDELDNGHPGLVAELNQALANPYAAFADGLVKKHRNFRFVATGNTFGRGPDRLFVGRNILDAATLDRFVTIEVPVDERLERLAALAYADDKSEAKVEKWVKTVQAARANIEAHTLPLVCSPRSSINGAKLLTAGLTEARVKEITLAKGWSKEHRQKVGV